MSDQPTPPKPSFPSIPVELPLTAENISELCGLGWHVTTCPLCGGTNAGSVESDTLTVTHYICSKCQRFTLTWPARIQVRNQSKANTDASAKFLERLSAAAAAAAEPAYFDEDAAWAIGHHGGTE